MASFVSFFPASVVLRQSVSGLAAALCLLAAVRQTVFVGQLLQLPDTSWVFVINAVCSALFYVLLCSRFIVRVPSQHSLGSVRHWLVALSGTFLPLAAQPAVTLTGQWTQPLWLPELALGVQLAGIVVTLAALLALGDSFGVVAAKRSIKTGGLYGWVRHPLYAGEQLWFAGVVMAIAGWGSLAVWLLHALLQWQRIVDEETLLLQDQQYRQYAQTVRYRVLPGLF